MYGHRILCYFNSKGKDQPGQVANPGRGRLSRENKYSLCPFARENSVSLDGSGRPVPRQPAHSPYSVRLNLVLTYGIPSDFRDGDHLFV